MPKYQTRANNQNHVVEIQTLKHKLNNETVKSI